MLFISQVLLLLFVALHDKMGTLRGVLAGNMLFFFSCKLEKPSASKYKFFSVIFLTYFPLGCSFLRFEDLDIFCEFS